MKKLIIFAMLFGCAGESFEFKDSQETSETSAEEEPEYSLGNNSEPQTDLCRMVITQHVDFNGKSFDISYLPPCDQFWIDQGDPAPDKLEVFEQVENPGPEM